MRIPHVGIYLKEMKSLSQINICTPTMTAADSLMDTQNRLTAVREERAGGWIRKVKGLSKEKKSKTHGHRQQFGDCQREAGVEGGRRG